MAQKTFTFELRVHHDDPSDEKDKIIEQVVRMACKHAFTSASLLADKRKPEAALSSGDMFEGVKEISLADDLMPEEELRSNLGLPATET